MTTPPITVPFLDLRATYLELEGELDLAVKTSFASGHYILGETVEAFERAFASFVGARHCVGVGNGLDALTVALHAGGVGPGDEVLVPSNTFIATWLAVSHLGATPVPVEPNEASYVIDADAAARRITPRTRAIVPVHLYGLPVDMAPFRALASKHGLFLLEDAAQAHGAANGSVRVGAGPSDAAAWSFYPGKNLGAFGDGGALTTNDDQLAERFRRLRNYGSSVKYVHDDLGWNTRLDPVQAAVLSVKLTRLTEWNARRAAVAAAYLEGLRGVPGLTLPVVPAGDRHAWHLFVVQSARRDALREALAGYGVQTLIHYPIAPHRQGAYAAAMRGEVLPVADRLHARVLSLPIGPHLTLAQQQHVIASVREAAGRLA